MTAMWSRQLCPMGRLSINEASMYFCGHTEDRTDQATWGVGAEAEQARLFQEAMRWAAATIQAAERARQATRQVRNLSPGTSGVLGPQPPETQSVGPAATAEEAIAMTVQHLPAGCGPTFPGTPEQLAVHEAATRPADGGSPRGGLTAGDRHGR
ncbi:DUF6193 family natural product biosynthesis protein [Streptomyces sp. AN091965]|uniref:DUF6193 family natural product biosynthesis protein n=1 Tax=Streptomyces sp. AN091965 TaxID=2927803 RepID=UPI0027E5744B|nr:DUF6193 family natural product biosynthesis protein [Streptomyces sp. AN091965]